MTSSFRQSAYQNRRTPLRRSVASGEAGTRRAKTLSPVLIVLAGLVIGPTARGADCSSAADQTTMNECAGQDYKKADAELNALYKQMQQRLKGDDEQMKRLAATQRAWIAFRDAECKFIGQPGPVAGSIEPMIEANCLASLTLKRSADFHGFLTCPEGDMSCPLPPK